MYTVTEICEKLDSASKSYYTPGCVSPLSDSEYDHLLDTLKKLDPTNHRITRVGNQYAADELRTKKQHSYRPMGSLNNIDGGINGLQQWITKLYAAVGQIGLTVSHKLDGCSIALYYEKGELKSAITRGNGLAGDDVTANAVKWQGIVKQLPAPFDGTIRGEVILELDEFNALNEELGTDPNDITNPRNVGNGIIGRLDGAHNERMKFYAFNAYTGTASKRSLSEKYVLLASFGFFVVPHKKYEGTAATITEAIQHWHDTLVDGQRAKLQYEIDGLVIAANDPEAQQALETDEQTILRPKHSAALKFPSHKNNTTLESVSLTVGHTGAIIPTANVKPVKIGGVTVSRALLNNWDEIKRLNISISDEVTLELAGDIIPKVLAVHKKHNGPAITEPSHCPSCGSATTRLLRGKPGAVTYCTNPSQCREALRYKILHFIGTGRKGIGIKGIGDSLLDVLTTGDNPLVKTPADLYRLTEDQLSALQYENDGKTIKLGKSRAKSIIAEITKAKSITLPQFLGALGIDLLGTRRVELLLDTVGHELQDWLNDDNLSKIPGDVIQESIKAGIQTYRPLIDDLLSVGVTIESKKKSINTTGGILAGVSICFTGTRELLKEAEAAGAIIKSGVSRGLQYLVQKDATSESSKSKKALEYGTQIISVDYLREVLAGNAKL